MSSAMINSGSNADLSHNPQLPLLQVCAMMTTYILERHFDLHH